MTQPATRDATSYPAAELDRRFYAFALDRLLAWGIYAGATYAAIRYLIEPGDLEVGLAVIGGTVLLVGLATAVLLGLTGLTPGKALVGIRVVREEGGAPIGVLAALLRTTILGLATLPTFGLGIATLAWTAVMDAGGWRRGWHDHVSHGVVVDVRPVPVVEDSGEERPRQVVNLTAMRLMPPPAPPEVATPERSAPRTPGAPAPPLAHSSRPAPPLAAPTGHQGPGFTPTPTPVPQLPPGEERVPQPTPDSVEPAVSVPAPAPGRRPPAPSPGPSLVDPAAPARPAGSTSMTQWRVTFDSGETFVVAGLALVGRRPEPRPGEPVTHVVPLRSSDMSLSKTHAQFQVVPDGALVVMDRGSTNGSVVVRQGVSKALAAGRPSTLLDGDTVRFGDRTMTVERVPR